MAAYGKLKLLFRRIFSKFTAITTGHFAEVTFGAIFDETYKKFLYELPKSSDIEIVRR